MDRHAYQLLLGICSSLVAVGVALGLEEILGTQAQRSAVIWLAAILIGAATFGTLVTFGRRVLEHQIEPRIKARLYDEISAEVAENVRLEAQQQLRTKTGIVGIFQNFRECEAEVLAALAEASDIRAFLQMGRTVLAGNANFYEELGAKVSPNARVRILHATEESPYLSERHARSRGSSYGVWSADLAHASRKLDQLSHNAGVSLEGRPHHEGYVWRIFLIDNTAYVQPYLYEKDNSTRAPVLKISRTANDGKTEPNSLYHAFSTYFDQKWEENVPESTRLDEIIPATETGVAAAVLQRGQFFVFGIPRRYFERDSIELPFHGLGGKRLPGEKWTDAVHREIREELGARIELKPSSVTRYVTTGAEFPSLTVADQPRPFCIYKRTRSNDPNFSNSDTLWLVGYEAQVVDDISSLRPGAELGAVVILTGDMLIRTLHESVKVSDLDQATDGSRIVLAGDLSPHPGLRLIPSGLATIVASSQSPRLARRL